MATKKITEKKTGEKYTSKAAMMKHEKGESKAEMKKEYGKVKSPLKMAGTVKAIATKSGVKPTIKAAVITIKGKTATPAKMKKC